MNIRDLINFLDINRNKLKHLDVEKDLIENSFLYIRLFYSDNFISFHIFEEGVFVEILFKNSSSYIVDMKEEISNKICLNSNFDFYNFFKYINNIYHER